MPIRRPVARFAPWQAASTSVNSVRSDTSIARWACNSAEAASGSPAVPPVWVGTARLVRSLRPTFSTTTGLPRAAARSSAAMKRSGCRIVSMNAPIASVRGSSTRYSR